MSRFDDKVRENVQLHLQPGEQLQGAFAGQSRIGSRNVYYTVTVATDRRILVFLSGVLSQTKIKKQLEELPRQTRIGPTDSLLWRKLRLGNEGIYVNRRFWNRVEAIDAAAGFV